MARQPPDPFFVLRSHFGGVTALCFIHEEEEEYHCNSHGSFFPYTAYPCLISGSDIGEIFIWNLKINRVACKLNQQDKKMILWLHYFQRNVLSHVREIGIKIWNYMDEAWVVTRTIDIEEVGFCSSDILNIHNNAHVILPGPKNSCVSVINFETCEVTSVLEPLEFGMCMCLHAYTVNERGYVICGYENGSVVLWDCQSTSFISSLSCHKEPVMCLDYDKSHKRSGISGSTDDHLLVWKLDDELKLHIKEKIKLTNPGVASVAIRQDSKIVIIGCWDSSLRVFSWKTLRPLAVFQFHSNAINCIKFFPGPIGKYKTGFAAGSKDNNITLWSIY